MTVYTSLLTFIAAASLLTVTPGLDTALVLRTVATRGPRQAVLAGVGIATGCFGWATLITATRPLSRVLQRPRVVQACDRLTGGMFVAFGVGLAAQRSAS